MVATWGRRTPLTGDITVGRDQSNSIVLEMDNVSRRHARFFQVDDNVLTSKTSARPTEPSLTTHDISGKTQLKNGDLVKVGGAIFKFISGGNVEGLYHEEIYRMTIIDGLTQIHNQAATSMDFLEREIARCSRYRRDLSRWRMFDIDHFKKLNDSYGHLAGDYVLRKMAQLIREKVRREELFARYGGEEFAFVLPETAAERARKLGEKVRAMIESEVFLFDEEEIRCTLSMGHHLDSRRVRQPAGAHQARRRSPLPGQIQRPQSCHRPSELRDGHPRLKPAVRPAARTTLSGISLTIPLAQWLASEYNESCEVSVAVERFVAPPGADLDPFSFLS